MHNDKYAIEYYELLKKDEKKYYEDYKDLVEKVNNSSAYYHGEPIPVTYQGCFYYKTAKADLRKRLQRNM